MPNDFYIPSGAPASGSGVSSAPIRSEFATISAAFDKLPALAGSAGRIIAVNATATALEAVSSAAVLTAIEALPLAGGVMTGNLKIGIAGDRLVNGTLPRVTIEGSTESTARIALVRASTDAGGASVLIGKTRGAIGSNTLVAANDQIGEVVFGANNGTAMQQVAAIRATVESATASSLPTRLSLWTTPSGSVSALERMRIDGEGRITINEPGSWSARMTVSDDSAVGNTIFLRAAGNIGSSISPGVSIERRTISGGFLANDPMGSILFWGLSSNGASGATATIQAIADGSSGSNSLVPSRVSVSTSASGFLEINKTGGSGTGVIAQTSVSGGLLGTFGSTVTITFTAPGVYNVSGAGTGNPVGLSYTNPQLVSFNGWQVNMSGTFAAGDTWTIRGNNSPVERMLINGAGDVQVGRTASSSAPASGPVQGRLFVGKTTQAGNVALWAARAGGIAALLESDVATTETLQVFNSQSTGDNVFATFLTDAGGTVRGRIDYNRAGGAVRYNTTSDYRAKDIFGPATGALDALLALRPYRGRMHGAVLERPMFVAHELQGVAPYAVSGTKDEVDADGMPVLQTVDHSILVPLIVAAMQELARRVDSTTTIH